MRLSVLLNPQVRPAVILLACGLALVALDAASGRVLTAATAFSVLQGFATLAPVAIGLGLTMLMREFDLSIAGLFPLAGCIGVLTGANSLLVGLGCAVAAGFAIGLIQGIIIVRLRLASVGVTLGGLLVCIGIAYLLTESRSLPYDNLDVAMALGQRFWGFFSIRSAVAVGVVAVAALIVGGTRIGRDMIATGSHRQASATAGVSTDALIIGTFAISGLLTAMSGALLSFSLASASPSGLSDVLVPAAAAAIIGGVSLGGGTGRPLGIACGVLTLSLLRAGLNAVGAPPFANDVTMGSVLLLVGILDAPRLKQRLQAVGRRLAPQ
jgi:ribose/xylose/arabinose/galactoside ABC-type transport system permease subunit